MSKKLPSYEEYQKEKYKAFESMSKQWQPAGVLCPKCEIQELEYDSFCVLPSNPPQYRARCHKCGWNGTI